MRLIIVFVFLVLEIAFANEVDCSKVVPVIGFDKKEINYFACLNRYYRDLGEKEANEKCSKLTQLENFLDENFVRCDDMLQVDWPKLSRLATDKCLELYKHNDFLMPSFSTCIQRISVGPSNRTLKQVKIDKALAVDDCLRLSKKVDFTSNSFSKCYFTFGGNPFPLSLNDAYLSKRVAMLCAENLHAFVQNNEKISECWESNRRLGKKHKTIIEICFPKKEGIPNR